MKTNKPLSLLTTEALCTYTKGFLRSTRSVKKQKTQPALPVLQLHAHPLLIQNQKEFRDELNHGCGRAEKGSWPPSSPVVLKTHPQVQLEVPVICILVGTAIEPPRRTLETESEW